MDDNPVENPSPDVKEEEHSEVAEDEKEKLSLSKSGAGGDESDESTESENEKLKKEPSLSPNVDTALHDQTQITKSKKESQEEEREKMQVLVSNFTEDQLNQYEMYRRSAFPKASIKRLMMAITGCTVSQNVVIAMSGIAKVFVGEVVESALDAMERSGEPGPIQPKHIREAVRKLRNQSGIPSSRIKKTLFRR